MLFKISIKKLFLIVLGLKLVSSIEGQSCFYNGKILGTCKLFNSCPFIVDHITNYFECGIKGNDILLCCPNQFEKLQQQQEPNVEFKETLRIHEKKCKEYHLKVFEKSILVHQKCNTTNSYTSNDVLARSKEFPHMALIGFPSKNNQNKLEQWKCGGTLISDRYVLTAGHCIFSREFGHPVLVRLGELNINGYQNNTEFKKFEDFIIEKLIPHPNYRIFSKYHDIALIKLNRTVQLTSSICPACLPKQFEESTSQVVIATGWKNQFEKLLKRYDDVEVDDNIESTIINTTTIASRQLKKIILEQFPYNECNFIYKSSINRSLRYGIIDSIQLCAGSRNSTMDSCQGDSGGPLQIHQSINECMYIIIGVISFGFSCGHAGIPGVYTRVFPYIDWIESHVW